MPLGRRPKLSLVFGQDERGCAARTRWTPYLIGLSVIDLALSVLIGFVGASGGAEFDWSLAAAIGTAVGTTLLAVVTGLLAYSTSRDVSATAEIARLTKQDQDARNRPVVVVHPTIRAGASKIPVTVTNVGLGPALGVYVTARYAVEGDEQPTILPVMFGVLAPGESETSDIEATFHRRGPIQPAWAIHGYYTDRDFSARFDVITDIATRVLTMPGSIPIDLGNVRQETRPYSNPVAE